MKKVIFCVIILLLLANFSYAFRTGKPPRFTKLDDPVQLTQLNNTLEDLWNITNSRYQMGIVTSNPDGSRKGDIGDFVLFNDSGTYYLAINTTGVKVWRSVLLQDTP